MTDKATNKAGAPRVLAQMGTSLNGPNKSNIAHFFDNHRSMSLAIQCKKGVSLATKAEGHLC